MNIVIIGRQVGCVWCTRAKELLEHNGQVYEFFGLEEFPQLREFASAMGIRSVPAIFIDGKLIGGYTELEAIFDPTALKEIFVNGESCKVGGVALDYARLATLAGLNPDQVYSATYSNGSNEQREGIMTPRDGKSVRIVSGMRFEICHTGNA